MATFALSFNAYTYSLRYAVQFRYAIKTNRDLDAEKIMTLMDLPPKRYKSVTTAGILICATCHTST
jgi:hypothetical protein